MQYLARNLYFKISYPLATVEIALILRVYEYNK